MSYRVQMMTSDQIEKMTDDLLFQELKRLRKLIYRMKKSGEVTRLAEEEMCYMQVEAQRRGHTA